MVILGLTGSIGMGKSTAAEMFRRLHIPVYDSDAQVHRLMAAGGDAVEPVEAAFPGVTSKGGIDRSALRERVFGNAEALARLDTLGENVAGRIEVNDGAAHGEEHQHHGQCQYGRSAAN